MRRKGERKLERTWPDWDCGWHPVRQMIDTGDQWLQAWVVQAATPVATLARKSKVDEGRLWAILRGDYIGRDELEAIAAVWEVDPAQVIASLPDAALLRD